MLLSLASIAESTSFSSFPKVKKHNKNSILRKLMFSLEIWWKHMESLQPVEEMNNESKAIHNTCCPFLFTHNTLHTYNFFPIKSKGLKKKMGWKYKK